MEESRFPREKNVEAGRKGEELERKIQARILGEEMGRSAEWVGPE